ncbi:hypothetical protein [Piscibacillus salipiscarius]|uniref:hypothetical protein n=1 Tax=Piscibacillus salipiscarius TaxID=299480 RepID=UPI002436AD38|nr:hypothetical protein [Piscibacillus salipiscarius]
MGNNFPKWIEASLHTLKSLTDGEKEDIHVGEAWHAGLTLRSLKVLLFMKKLV